MKTPIQTSEYTITFEGEWDSPHSKIIDIAISSALSSTTKLSSDILSMSGYSGKYNRIILNTIVQEMPDARYLEVGSWLGSTACSALYENSCKITCIDNYHDNGLLGTASKDDLIGNLEKFKNENVTYNFIDSDYRLVDYTALGKYNIYFYDGPHKSKDQYDGFMLGLQAMEDEFILIVDDWNWDKTRDGTLNAIKDSGVQVISAMHTISQIVEWNNGYYIAAIKK